MLKLRQITLVENKKNKVYFSSLTWQGLLYLYCNITFNTSLIIVNEFQFSVPFSRYCTCL